MQEISKYLLIRFSSYNSSICNNTTANPERRGDGTFEQLGNKTECALIEVAYKMGHDYKEIRKTDKVLFGINSDFQSNSVLFCSKKNDNCVSNLEQ